MYRLYSDVKLLSFFRVIYKDLGFDTIIFEICTQFIKKYLGLND